MDSIQDSKRSPVIPQDSASATGMANQRGNNAWVTIEVPVRRKWPQCSADSVDTKKRFTVFTPVTAGRGSRPAPESSGTVRSRLIGWRRKAATVVAGALAVMMAYGVVFGHNGLTAFARKRQEEHDLRVQMQQLQQENARMRGHVDRLQNDPSAIEHQAREELHYTRAGEVIYTLPAPVGSHSVAVPND